VENCCKHISFPTDIDQQAMAKLTLNKAALRLLLQLPTNTRKLWLTFLEDLHGHRHDAGVNKDLAADGVETVMKYDWTSMISQCMHCGCKCCLLFIKEEALFQAPVDQLRGTTASDSAEPKTFWRRNFNVSPECKESLDCVTNATKAAKSQSSQMPKASGADPPSKKAISPQTPAKANDTQTQEPSKAPISISTQWLDSYAACHEGF
jgi:hypothetical protein